MWQSLAEHWGEAVKDIIEKEACPEDLGSQGRNLRHSILGAWFLQKKKQINMRSLRE